MISHQPDIDKIYLYIKDPNKAKYQFLIKNREDIGTKHLNYSKTFTEYSNDMDDIYKTAKKYNPNKKRKILIVFDDVIANILSNKKHNPILTEFLIRDRKLNTSFVFITQSYSPVPKILN